MSFQRKAHVGTIITTVTMRLNLDAAQEASVRAAGHLHTSAVGSVLGLIKTGATDARIEQQIKQRYGVNRRWARAFMTDARMTLDSVVEGARTRCSGADDRIKRLEKRARKATKAQQRGAQQTRERLDRARARATLDRQIAESEIFPSIVLGTGGGTLIRKRESVRGAMEKIAWSEQWQRSRSAQLFMPGDKDRRCGNPAFQYDRATNKLDIKLFTGERFTTQPVSADTRLDELLLGYDGPVTIRITWSEKKRAWYAHFTIRQPVTPCLTDRKHGALGVDTNLDHLAVSRIDASGNPVQHTRLDIVMGASRHETLQRAAQAAHEIVELALEARCPIALERLNFGSARLNLRYLPRALRVKFSSFAYTAYLTAIKRAALRAGIEVIEVAPAFTSVLGQTNYAASYGVSVDLAAAICIARRALKFRERVRPSVVHSLALVERAEGSSDDAHVERVKRSRVHPRACSRKLPSRRDTWGTSQLARSGLHGLVCASADAGVIMTSRELPPGSSDRASELRSLAPTP